MFLDDRIGSIEVGKDADLAVWDRNPYTVPSAELKDMRCEMTFVRGRVSTRNDDRPDRDPMQSGSDRAQIARCSSGV